MSGQDKGLCLVMGGAGFIGSHTVDALLTRGYSARILDILHPRIHPKGKPGHLPNEAEFIWGDVSNRDDLSRALRDVRYVFHLAAYQDYLLDFSTFIHVNVESTALLFELIVEKGHPVEKVVVASSQAVYGEGRYRCETDGIVYPGLREESRLRRWDWEPVCPKCKCAVVWERTEEREANPQNQYALSKWAQEMIALRLGQCYRVPTVALRYSIVQGPRQSFHNAYSGVCRIFCLSLYLNQRPLVYEDGRQVRDYVNIRDVVAANLLVLERPEANYQVFNVGGGRGYSVLEFAEIVARMFGKSIQPEIPGVYRFGEARHIVSDISKLEALGWSPRCTPEESVRDYVSWLREQDGIEDVLAYARRHMRERNVLRSVSR
ncbi:MAG: NAD-dependent epimerase/dehydratase family protein [Candidatus Methylomirabilales bacterium]